MQSRWLWVFAATIVLVISIAALAGSPPSLGKTAPDFKLPDLDGRETVLSEVISAHRATLVNFWATWCPPCRAEIPELDSFYRTYKHKGLSLLAVNCREDTAHLRAFVREREIGFPVLLDRQGKVAAAYGVSAIPTTFVLDGRGAIVAKFLGQVNHRMLADKVLPLLETK